MRRLLVLSTALLAVLGARGAQGQNYVQGPYGPGGTWNVYSFVLDSPLQWIDANEDAISQTYSGKTGHLADVLSLEENQFINGLSNLQGLWIGLTDREGVAPQRTNYGALAPQEATTNTTMGWAWTSGKEFVFNNWVPGEPNNWNGTAAGTATTGYEDVVELYSSGQWNDHSGGFGLNEPIVPTLQPNTSTDESAGPTRNYVIEFPVESLTMIPGIPAPGIPTQMPEDLPGIDGTPGNVGVTMYYDLGGTVSGIAGARNFIEQIKSGDLEPGLTESAQLAVTDMTDPDTSAAGGPAIFRNPLEFPGQVTDGDTAESDNDFIGVAKGKFTVPTTGTYTIQSRSDDGMGFRVIGKQFTSVHGGGTMDVDGSMVSPNDTGDADTRGVIELTAGEHEFEAMMWERGGGAWWEMSIVDGSHPNADLPSTPWRPLIGPAVPYLPTNLPGVDGGNGTVGVTDYAGLGQTVSGLENAANLIEEIKSGALEPDVVVSQQYTRTDVADPNTSAGGGPSVGGTPNPFPSDTPADDDDFLSVAKGTIMVTEPGTYTIQVRSDDGMGLRMIGQSFGAVHGGGRLDYDGAMVFRDDTGDANSRGVIELTAGKHDFEFLYWERGGGAFWEISSAQGDAGSTGIAQWLALGDTSVLPPKTTGPVAKLTGPLSVGSLLGVTDIDVEIAREELLDAVGNFDFESNSITQLVIDDHNTAAGCPFNEIPTFHVAPFAQWPANDTAVGGDGTNHENFGNLIIGEFTVNDGDAVAGEALQLTFHVDVDDRSIIRVVGESFSAATTGTGVGLLEIEGDDAMWSNNGICNQNYNGLITLTEGVTYDLEATHVDNTGDSGLQVLVALGDYLNNSFDTLAFFPLTSLGTTVSYAGNKGLALVAKGGLAGDHNGNGTLDAADLDLQAAQMVLNPVPPPAGYDLNADNKVNYNDRLVWLHDLRKTWVGDSNLDGLFTSDDFVLAFQAGKYEVAGAAATWVQGDWNGDQFFTSADFVAAFADGGYEAGPRAAVSAVPEPSSLVLVLLGLAGLLGVARRRG